MKIKFLLLAAILFIFLSSAAFAQSVSVSPRKVTYTRPKPLADFKKNFTVTYPKIKGTSPAMARKIESVISYERNFNFNLREELREIQWLEEADFEVKYNKNGILGVELFISGSGAYPSGVTKSVVVNLQTGGRVAPTDVFTNLPALAAKAKTVQQAEVKQAIIDIKKNDPEEENPARLFENTNFTVKDLKEFSIDDRGVTFWYDYGFPHVIQAWQPDGRYFMSWAELKPFVKPGGAFARFIR